MCLTKTSNMEKRYNCIPSYVTGSEIVLSWLPIRLKILHWRPEFHNRSPAGKLTISGQLWFAAKIDLNKIQSRPPIGHLLFTFLLLLKYKTDFPLIIIYHNVSQLRSVQSLVAMYLQRFPITYVLRTVQGAAWLWPCASRMATSRLSWQNAKGKIIEQSTKWQFFCRPQEKV